MQAWLKKQGARSSALVAEKALTAAKAQYTVVPAQWVGEMLDRLAGVAGLAPVPRDSGRISGNNHRPRRYDRRLLRVCYLAAMSSLTRIRD